MAYAIAKHLTAVRGFTLFATHFHEMARLGQDVPDVKNAHMRAVVRDQKLTLLYEVADGSTDESYGIEAAEIVKFPQEVIARAKRKAAELAVVTSRHLKTARREHTTVARLLLAPSADDFVTSCREQSAALAVVAAS